MSKHISRVGWSEMNIPIDNFQSRLASVTLFENKETTLNTICTNEEQQKRQCGLIKKCRIITLVLILGLFLRLGFWLCIRAGSLDLSDMCALSVFHPIMDLLQLKHIPPSAAEQISNKNVFTSNGSRYKKPCHTRGRHFAESNCPPFCPWLRY